MAALPKTRFPLLLSLAFFLVSFSAALTDAAENDIPASDPLLAYDGVWQFDNVEDVLAIIERQNLEATRDWAVEAVIVAPRPHTPPPPPAPDLRRELRELRLHLSFARGSLEWKKANGQNADFHPYGDFTVKVRQGGSCTLGFQWEALRFEALEDKIALGEEPDRLLLRRVAN